MYSLYLDDERVPTTKRSWTIVRSYEEAIETMSVCGCPEYMSFDHDLCSLIHDGYEVAKWMVTEDQIQDGKFIPSNFEFNVHSANPVGAENIRAYLDGYISFKERYYD